jgi:CRP-like cAMP-binding protein
MAGLLQSHLFDALSSEEVLLFAESALVRPFAPGETAVQQGDPGSSLFFVLQGEMAVEVDGREVARMEQGRMFGEMSLLTGEPRRATVRACTEVLLAELPKEAIAELMDRNEKLMERLSEALTRHRTASREQLDRRPDEIAAERSPVEYLKRLKAFFGKG